MMSTVIESGMYVSLTKEEYIIIQNDIELFRTNCVGRYAANGQRYTVNGFMNIVFVNMERKDSGELTLSKQRKRKGIGMNIKLNRDVVEKIRDAGLDPMKKSSSECSAYYMQFIEAYCRLPLTGREMIFYRVICERLEDSIKLHHFLRIKKNDGQSVNILPFAVKQADEIHKNYLIGFSLKKRSNGYRYKNTLCVPLRKIIDCRRVASLDPEKDIHFGKNSVFSCYRDLKSYIQNRLVTDGVLYLGGKLMNVTVRLSNTGIKKLSEHTLFRPVFTSDKNDEHIIYFRATRLQTFKYFFQFGSDAEILEPGEYRKEFSNAYRSAFELYSQKKTVTVKETD